MDENRTLVGRFLNWHWDYENTSTFSYLVKYYVGIFFGLGTLYAPCVIPMVCFVMGYDNTFIYIFGVLYFILLIFLLKKNESLVNDVMEIFGAIWYYILSTFFFIFITGSVIYFFVLLRNSGH